MVKKGHNIVKMEETCKLWLPSNRYHHFYHPHMGDSKSFHLSYGKDIFNFYSHLPKKNGILFLTVHLPLSKACLSCVELQTDLIACTQTLTQILCHKETHQSTSQPINKKDDIQKGEQWKASLCNTYMHCTISVE